MRWSFASMARPALVALASGSLLFAFAGAALSEDSRRDAAPKCAAAAVERGVVHAGPFTGHVSRRYVVDGRFRLYDLLHPTGESRLSNKMGWFLPRRRATEAPWVAVKGVRLVPRGRVFTDRLAEAFGSGFPEDQH